MSAIQNKEDREIPVQVAHHKALEVRRHEAVERRPREESVLRSVRLVICRHVQLRVPQCDADVVQQPRQGSQFENSILQ